MLPERARPVPFCFHGFLPPPLTNPFVLVAAVPARRPASWLRTAACRRCSRTGPASTTAGTSSSPTFSRVCDTTGTVTVPSAIVLAPPFRALADHDRAVPRARHRAAEEKKIVVGAHRDDDDVPRRH